MCTPPSTLQSASALYRCCPLLSHFQYIDRWTCPRHVQTCPGPSELPPHVLLGEVSGNKYRSCSNVYQQMKQSLAAMPGQEISHAVCFQWVYSTATSSKPSSTAACLSVHVTINYLGASDNLCTLVWLTGPKGYKTKGPVLTVPTVVPLRP